MTEISRRKLMNARTSLRLSRKAAAALIEAHELTVTRWEMGKGGILENSKERIREYCKALSSYANALGLNPENYRTHLLCPGEFPNPDLLPSSRQGMPSEEMW